MVTLKRIKQNIKNYLFDHPRQKEAIYFINCLIVTIVSSFFFTFGFNVFISPNINAIISSSPELISSNTIKVFATGGTSGLGQILLSLLKFCNVAFLKDSQIAQISYWVLYTLISIPFNIFAFVKLGKRFGIFSILNILISTLFGILFSSNDPEFFINKIAIFFIDQPLARVLFAGICTGISSGLAYYIESAAGCIDILSYYFGEKKSSLVGKFGLILNFVIVIVFTLISCIKLPDGFEEANDLYLAIATFIFTLIYLYVVSFTINKVNIFNLKIRVQIITNVEQMASIIINVLPHSCTIIEGKGAYTGNIKYLLLVDIRKKEFKRLSQIVHDVDPKAFVDVMILENVYGKFYRRSIK